MTISNKVFQKRKEDFQCEQCGCFVTGSGYTNHCPRCLFSKHVDIFPGDRAESCGGLMEPVALEKERGEERIVHRCRRCGFLRRNRVQQGDDFDERIRVAKRQSTL